MNPNRESLSGVALQAPMQPPQLDQDAVNLAKAIRQVESTHDFSKKGASGEMGGYQYKPDTWNMYSKKYLGRDVPLERATPEEQNEVAYKRIKEWKDAGYHPGQIASMWNAGDGEPNAYRGVFSDGRRAEGVNQYGVRYSVPEYATKVANAYQQIKLGVVQPMSPLLTDQSRAGDPRAEDRVRTPEEPRMGIMQSLAQTVARPFLKGAANVGALLEAGNPEAYEKIQREGLDFGYLGKARPIGSKYDDKGKEKTFGKRVEETIGTGLEASSYVAPSGALVKTAQALRGGRVLPVAAKAAFTGAEGGAVMGAGQALQEGKDLKGVASEAGIGALGGAAGGLLLGGVGGAIGKRVGPGRQQAAIREGYKGLSQVENQNAPIRKYVAEQSARGFDVKDDIAKSGLLAGSVDKDGVIRTADAISKYQKALEGREGVVRQILEKEGGTINISELEKRMIQSIDERGLKGAARRRALNEAREDIQGYIDEVGSDDIPLTLIHDAKVDKYANIDYSKEESKRASKAIAKALKRAVEDKTRAIEVKKINEELSRHFANIGFLEKLDGKRVAGGRLGKYFAGTLGGMVGSAFGPLEALVAADVASRVVGRQLSSKFPKVKGGMIPKESPLMQRAIRIAQGEERKVPVISRPSDFVGPENLPTIPVGPKPRSKYKKADPKLPVINY